LLRKSSAALMKSTLRLKSLLRFKFTREE